MAMPNYWIGVISADHVKVAVTEGVCAFSHGKETAVEKLSAGDRFIYYSPKTGINQGAIVQGFTALGTVTSGLPYQKQWAGAEVTAWVLEAKYQSTRLVSIRPLIANLGFIRNPKYWGMVFRRSLFAVDTQDFTLIETAMKQVQA